MRYRRSPAISIHVQYSELQFGTRGDFCRSRSADNVRNVKRGTQRFNALGKFHYGSVMLNGENFAVHKHPWCEFIQ